MKTKDYTLTGAELQILVHALADYKYHLKPTESILADPESNRSRLYLYNTTAALLDQVKTDLRLL
jgi:hypothetical protein